MPEYAGFNIALISQYDAATIPEDDIRVDFALSSLHSPHLDTLNLEKQSPALSEQHPDKTFAEAQQQRPSTVVVEATIPVLAGSQFWIVYECPLPWETHGDGEGRGSEDGSESNEDGGEGAGLESKVKYYYFKLYVGATCVLSWGVGEQDGWQGKTVFGLFDGGRDFEGRQVVEKRGLFYPTGRKFGADGGFEIRVFRAKGRRSQEVRYRGFGEVLAGGKGCCALDFTCVGSAKRGESRRSYTYALIDAKDEPWVVFRYRFEGEEADDTVQDAATSVATEYTDVEETYVEPAESSMWSDLEQNTPPSQPSVTSAEDMTERIRRLSFPPRNPLYPPTIRATELPSPTKQLTSASDDDLARIRPHPQVTKSPSIRLSDASPPRRTTGLRKPEWTAVRTASPLITGASKGVDSVGETTTTVTAAHRKSTSSTGSGSGGLLRSVVASALRRREDKGSR